MAKYAPNIFVSAQLRDMPLFVNLIYQSLVHKLGSEHVFMDKRHNAVTNDWRVETEQVVRECDAMLIVIGPKWCHILQDHLQQYRTDWAMEEINLALLYNKPIVPILIGGATVPGILPPSLMALKHFHAWYVNSPQEWLDLTVDVLVRLL